MTFSPTTTDTAHPSQASGVEQATAPTQIYNTTSALGLLHDDKLGNNPVESKDIAILRRLKLAILEGQHPYFKANVDLSNLQDLVLASGSRPVGPNLHSSPLDTTPAQPSGHPRRNVPPALDDLGSSGPNTLDYGNEDSNGVSADTLEKSLQPDTTTSARSEDVSMANLDSSEKSEQVGVNSQDESSGSPSSENRRTSAQTLGRYVLHSPVLSESHNQSAHARKPSDTPTLVDPSDQTAEPEVHVKRESSPYQLSGSQTQAELPSSSIASFTSNSTVSTELTSEDGGVPENAPDADVDLAGYNPKYGNKADYIRRQKVRSKAIESIDEKNRRTGYRPDDKPGQKSPVRPVDHGARRGSGPNVSPVRGRNPPSRTHTLTSVSESDGQRHSLRRTPPVDALPPPSFQPSPRGRPPPPTFRSISPTPGKYPTHHRPGDASPTRDYRQYMPYDDPRSARPRPIVSSPPRGSPPREPPAARTTIDRQPLDDYSNYPRTEARSFDLRPSPPSFSDGRATGSYIMDNDNNWFTHGPPRAPAPPPPSRNSPPPRDMNRSRTPFGSTTLPTNPNTGYRLQSLPDPPTSRYNSYDPPPRRVDWTSRDWDSSGRSTDSKPKLQDRFNVDSSWARDSLESRSLDGYAPRLRDEFTSHPSDEYASRYRRDPSPASRYADGFRSGFSRPPEVEGIRPMKRSRPDDGYIPRGGPRAGSLADFEECCSDTYRPKYGPKDDDYETHSRAPY
ncbi:unnamed protein product [Rhizoctonia solani]|uniref:Uncharacterized protein n=1 Tax=Rhizoctonia solani TaxID=456999 RepID=A0A8H3HY64_9AGAM|nr:unnamed protein product [Rhizoctonia solani]